MAHFTSKRKTTPREAAEPGELNIVPYLDILMNLIIFVLLSMTGLAAFGAVNVTAVTGPAVNGAPAEARLLTVGISAQGYSLATTGGALPAVAKKPDGSFDFTRLNEAARGYKLDFPGGSKVILTAEPQIPYEVLASTMDALRETPDHQPLFRDVTLSSSKQ